MSVKDDIKRLEKLRDDLLNLSDKLQFQVFGGKATSEVHDVVNIWAKLKDTLQDLIFSESGLETWKRAIKEDPENETFKKRLAVEEERLPKLLKRILKIEKEAQAVFDKYKNLKKEDVKEEEKEEKEPEKKVPEKKPEPKPTPKPAPKVEPRVSQPTAIDEHEDYVKRLDKLKTNSVRAIVANMPQIENDVLDFLRDYLDENFDVKDGNFVVNDKAIKGINSFTDIMTKAVAELKDYKGSVGQYLKNFKDMGTLMEEFQKSNGVNVKQARLGAVQELVTAEIINRYSENGLNPGFVQPLRELLFNNITGGLNKRQAMVQLKEFIAGGRDETGKLGRYLEQTAQQGVDSYSGAVNVRIVQTFKIDTYIQSGSLIQTSSPQCRFVVRELGGIIERKDWPKVKEIAEENGLIEGTTFDNLPINKNHWGCRHEFTPVILTAKQREKLLANPVNN